VRSVSLNVTVTQPTAGGHLRLYPGESQVPQIATLNYGAGQTRGNNGIFRLGTEGDLAVYRKQASGRVHLIIDINGYFTE
jgi:hypothetical protein